MVKTAKVKIEIEAIIKYETTKTNPFNLCLVDTEWLGEPKNANGCIVKASAVAIGYMNPDIKEVKDGVGSGKKNNSNHFKCKVCEKARNK
jgi:hypothetical protein